MAQRSSAMWQLLPALPDTKSKLEKAVEKTGRDDCRTAHSDKGLIGAAAVAVDNARNKGCKW